MSVQSWTQQFRGKTFDQPRPDRSQPRWTNAQPNELQTAQAGWDEAARIDARLLELTSASIARRAEAEAERRAKQRAFAEQQRAAADARILTPAWQRFRASGGTEEEFEAIKPQILAQARMNAALGVASDVASNADGAARRGMHSRIAG